MAQFNLTKEVTLILNELETLDLSNANILLNWLYRAIYFNNMYEDKRISGYVLEKITTAGYTEKLGKIEYYKSMSELISTTEKANDQLIFENLISEIIRSLKDNTPFDENLNTFIRIYNERFNSLLTNKTMMESLNNSIGLNIVYVVIRKNQFLLKNGRIDKVEDYIAITIDGERYPFIGLNVGIKTITTSDGKYLFNNPHLTKESDLINYNSIESLKNKTFGSALNDAKLRVQ